VLARCRVWCLALLLSHSGVVDLWGAGWPKAGCGPSGNRLSATSQPPPLFTFHSGFWLNADHFLYVLGRAAANAPDSHRSAVAGAVTDSESADLSGQARAAWKSAVSAYQNDFSERDLVFDREMAATTKTLAEADDDPAPPPTLGKPLDAVLESAAPIYREYWWPRHADADQEFTAELEELLAQYGRPIAEFIAKVWQQHWPSAGFTVEVSAYANWAGAYSTRGGLIVISSLASANAGSQGLETIFHEAMHQWDRAMAARIGKAARRLRQPVPSQLLHSLIFYTAGFAVSRTVPDHQPYAQVNGLWTRGSLHPLNDLDAYWRPYLEGKVELDEALRNLLSPAAAGLHPVK